MRKCWSRLLANLSERLWRKDSSPWGEAARAIREFASDSKGEVLVITHANADPDAVASALLLAHALTRLGVRKVVVAFPEGASKLSRKILEGLGMAVEYLSRPPRARYAAVAVVDATNRNQLGAFRGVLKGARVLLLDHHLPPGDVASIANYAIVMRETAATVIAYFAAKRLGVPVDQQLATLALAGLLFDTRRFLHATPNSLRVAVQLIEEGGDYALALSLLKEEEDFSERVAKLKGAMRCHVLRVGSYLVAASEVGSFEASVARALVALGADVVLVASERDGECRLSIRLSQLFHEKTSFSASRDLASRLTAGIRGEGGGHDTAASFKGTCTSSFALREALGIVTGTLRAKATPLK